MEGVAPTLYLCLEVRAALEKGQALEAVVSSIALRMERDLSGQIQRLISIYRHSGMTEAMKLPCESVYRQTLFNIIVSGLEGEPILDRVRDLEKEIRFACESDIERHVARVPLLVMIPIMLLQLPGFMLLLFGPILNQLTKELVK